MADPTRTSLEQRLVADEVRLARDEARLEVDEEQVRESRIVSWFAIAFAVVATLSAAALIVAIVALRQDVGAIRRAAGPQTVSTGALQDGSVTAAKLAPDAVGREAVAAGAIGSAELAPDSVNSSHVGANALVGADIRERTLARVPAAGDAARLGHIQAKAYLSQPFTVSATSVTSAQRIKGPVNARCPTGSRVVSGGAAIEGATSGAAIVSSAPVDAETWTATARVGSRSVHSWRLVVSAVCAAGGT